ncbi:hypothetical protein HPP92_021501 [Vanilla planifolia]|uniref:Peptidase A1 domain-containing protein n=1 Tax=Vanilla planifolia TaxID=51239 RepID=A0A835Q186_VANPL|nr:hypothetical protein HPP92_021501 [Vanilla planifolia]
MSWLPLLLFLLSTATQESVNAAESNILTLHRRIEHSNASRLERLRTAIHGDGLRQRMIAGVIGRRRKANEVDVPLPSLESTIEMPVWSGAYTGTGQYFVRVRLGTPAQPFLLVPDTGSDLTWVTCRYRGTTDLMSAVKDGRKNGQRSRRRRAKRIFEADLSRSFHPISCSSMSCQTELPFALTTCPKATSPCTYDYEYAQGSSAQGFFANESATVEFPNRRRMKLKGLVVGCTSSAVGSSFVSSDGVLALGHGPNTFVSRATARFGQRFSYCLVDHLSPRNATGYLTFGPNPFLPPHPSAPLILDPFLQPFYYVAVAGISVAGEVLRIPPSVWNYRRGGGVIVDSGSTLTVLADPAYGLVVNALSHRLAEVPRVQVDPFDYCYNWSSPKAAATCVPSFEVHFVGGARLSPPVKSYLIDVADGVKCLGFTSTPWPGVSIIGNIMQQEHIWEFDLENQRLGFHPSNCATGTLFP